MDGEKVMQMGQNEKPNNKREKVSFESLQQIRTSMKEGTFQEILDDWRWIFRYSRPYRDQILLYVFLGILSFEQILRQLLLLQKSLVQSGLGAFKERQGFLPDQIG